MSTLPGWQGLYAELRHLADEWSQEAAQRRRISASDPAADGMAHCAGQLKDRLEGLKEELRYVTPEDYAELRGGGVTAQSVRNWIKAGELEAVRGPKGWLIPLAAERRRARRLRREDQSGDSLESA